MDQLYDERLARYSTAMRNEKPDCVPIRPFVAEFTATYAGYTCQEVTQDYEKAFAAARKCAADFDWDAVVGNMVYGWAGLTQAIGLNYYGVPGIDLPVDIGFQYREPVEEEAFMRPDEYDALIEDPTGFLYNVWLPRVADPVCEIGSPSTFANNLSFVKGGLAMMQYFMGFGTQGARLKAECGMPGAISGILKAPLDIIADKLRGYLGLSMDIMNQPDKVLAACEALAPHLLHQALFGADPTGTVPIAIWMHRGCVPFVSPETFNTMYWPTLKPIIESIWAAGHQTLFYAEGDWNHHLDAFAELPDRSIIYHIDQADPMEVHEKLGHKFCLSGGLPNFLLGYGTPDQVRDYCKKLIDMLGADGGYIMDASAIVQNVAKVENIRAMTEFTREYGVYSDGHSSPPTPLEPDITPAQAAAAMPDRTTTLPPGTCDPWERFRGSLPGITGDEQLVKTIWENNDALANMYIWHCLLSF